MVDIILVINKWVLLQIKLNKNIMLISIKQLLRTAKERRAGSLGVAEQIILEYNGRKKTGSKLNLTKLYAKEISSDIDVEDESDEFAMSEEFLADEGEETDEGKRIAELSAEPECICDTVQSEWI